MTRISPVAAWPATSGVGTSKTAVRSALKAGLRMALDYALMTNSQLARRDFLIGLSGGVVAASRSLSAAGGRRTLEPTQGPSPRNSHAPGKPPAWMYVGSFTGDGRGHGEG